MGSAQSKPSDMVAKAARELQRPEQAAERVQALLAWYGPVPCASGTAHGSCAAFALRAGTLCMLYTAINYVIRQSVAVCARICCHCDVAMVSTCAAFLVP
jgi:hypothetical protein